MLRKSNHYKPYAESLHRIYTLYKMRVGKMLPAPVFGFHDSLKKYNWKNSGPRTVPWGDARQNGDQILFYSFMLSVTEKRISILESGKYKVMGMTCN